MESTEECPVCLIDTHINDWYILSQCQHKICNICEPKLHLPRDTSTSISTFLDSIRCPLCRSISITLNYPGFDSITSVNQLSFIERQYLTYYEAFAMNISNILPLVKTRIQSGTPIHFVTSFQSLSLPENTV